jgi:hypothetical protein
VRLCPLHSLRLSSATHCTRRSVPASQPQTVLCETLHPSQNAVGLCPLHSLRLSPATHCTRHRTPLPSSQTLRCLQHEGYCCCRGVKMLRRTSALPPPPRHLPPPKVGRQSTCCSQMCRCETLGWKWLGCVLWSGGGTLLRARALAMIQNKRELS